MNRSATIVTEVAEGEGNDRAPPINEDDQNDRVLINEGLQSMARAIQQRPQVIRTTFSTVRNDLCS